MRPILSSLMITSLLLATPAFADCTDRNNPTCSNHPAFQNLRKQVQDGAAATGVDDLNLALANTGLGASCNPVVWASLVQKARIAARKDVELASKVNNSRVPVSSSCTDAVNRSAVAQNARKSVQGLESSLLSAIANIFGVSVQAITNITNQLDLNATKIATDSLNRAIEKNCLSADALRAQIVNGVNQDIGTAALNTTTPGNIIASFRPVATSAGGNVIGDSSTAPSKAITSAPRENRVPVSPAPSTSPTANTTPPSLNAPAAVPPPSTPSNLYR